ncbi:MAG: alanine racemase [Deltaproteobacteria bacterium]|jgi:alanine racemase|nr:alanine racemase [Deltaproteobacteria bacterium]
MSLEDLSFNRAEIDLAALKANFRALRKYAPLRPMMAVVKADAYGHGLMECARALVEAEARDFGVLDVVEGCRLRAAQLGKIDIHVLAGLQTREQAQAALAHDLVLVIYSLPQLRALEELVPSGSQAQAYLKIDSGMGRLGLPWWEAQAVLPALTRQKKIHFRGFLTHLATAGDQEAKTQLERFQKIVELDQTLGLTAGRHSALAGPGLLAFPEYHDQFSRAGLLLYGANPLAGSDALISAKGLNLLKKLKPVMTVASQVIQTRTVRAGESLSYDRTFRASENLRVAVLPIGYAHGLSRSRSNQGGVLINGRLAPLLGRVCMNLSLYDVSQIPKAQPGQRAVLVGLAGRARVSMSQAASWQGTSAYETMCLFGRLNPRFYLDHN